MSNNQSIKQQAFSHKNVRLFVWFRVLFNCRFYYPVLAIFFVDLGLTLSQYITLNVIWAATIVLLEVPSGALADIIGRKKLVVGSAAIMVVEMALLVFAPQNAGWWLFAVCAVNRVLAGLAEAAASGADEALTYDSLEGDNKEQQWDEVLSSLGKRFSIGMAIAMVVGALLYDSSTFSFIERWTGLPMLSDNLIIRIPVFLCLLQGIVALIISLRLEDTHHESTQTSDIRGILRQTLKATAWVWHTTAVFVLIIGCMLVDSVVRNFATLTSAYYRHIDLPEFTFGFIGASIALSSFTVPYFAKPLARRFGFLTNIAIAASIALLGLVGLALCHSYWGILPAAITMTSIYHVGFIASRFLNQLTPSNLRATVLSVKGLLFNLGYAAFSIAFAQTLTWRQNQLEQSGSESASSSAFNDLLVWTPTLLTAALVIFFLLSLLAKNKINASSL